MSFDQPRIAAVFEETLSESLEGLAFIDVESRRTLGVLPEMAPDDWCSAITIEAPFTATVELFFGKRLARDLVDAMAGGDWPVDEAAIRDSLAEVANTVVGRFMNGLLEGTGDFTISLPDCGELGERPGGTGTAPERVVLEFNLANGKMYAVYTHMEVSPAS